MSARRRKIVSRIFEVLCGAAVLVALIPLALILFYVVKEGAGALNLAFFTQMPKPVGEAGGGMANAIVGTLMLIGQPSEETIDGAKAMMADHLYERFGKPNMAIALHDSPFPAGLVAVVSGPALASSTSIDVIMRGVGSHGAAPISCRLGALGVTHLHLHKLLGFGERRN